MQELIERLMNEAGLSETQASKALDTIKEYVIEKFPMMGGAVDSLFNSSGSSTDDDGL